MGSLDTSKLIEIGEAIIKDDQIGFAEKITRPVQIFRGGDNDYYELKLVLALVKPEGT